MNQHAKWLREAAEQIRREGHAGWGNTCEFAADEIDRLTRERDESLAAAEAAHERANHWTAEAARYHSERDEALAERDAMAKALDTIHSWLVCAAIASAEDMAQSFAEMEQIAVAALAQIEQERSEQAKEG